MKWKKLISGMAAFSVLMGMGTTAYANSARTHWSGVDSTGAIITDENCPIIVDSELLTFDISEFPENHYRSASDFLAYSGKVTAQYAFYNPADYEVTATLVFPFGPLPTYAYEDYDEDGSRASSDDTDKFDITMNGQVIDKTLRHTLFERYDQFDMDEDLALLSDGFVEDVFYYPEMLVTRYTYTVSGVDSDSYNAATVAMDIAPFDGTRKVLFLEQSGAHTQSDGTVRIGADVDYHDSFTLYVIGEPYDIMPEWSFYQNGDVEDGEEIRGTMTLVETENLIFQELVLLCYEADGIVSETDWYNAVVESFNQSGWESAGFIFAMDVHGLDVSDCLMRWYEYEITVEPGQTIVNTVEAPIYPSIDTDYDPNVFGYTYLLSPAKTWEQFGSLDIIINTPYYLLESSQDGFNKNDDGYVLHLTGLPEGDLEFTLSASPEPSTPKKTITDFVPIEMIISFSVILGVLVLVGGAAVILIVKKKRKGGR